MDRQTADYDGDFYAWTVAQAAAVRRAGEMRLNDDVDWENVAEEIETLGRSEYDAVYSHLETVIEHLLKLVYSPADYPRRGWKVTVDKARGGLRRKLSGTLRRMLEDDCAECFRRGRRYAAAGLEEDGVVADALPAVCPWTLDQLLDDDFWPAPAPVPAADPPA